MFGTKIGRALHVGCGGERLPAWINAEQEIRLDIDPQFKPDIVASATELGEIGEYDLVYSSHILEHLYPHELPKALSEFRRVLKTGGLCIAVVPDLEDVKPTEDVVYVSPAGPVAGLDMFYGFRKLLQEMPYMAHHNAFVAETLKGALTAAGFASVNVKRAGDYNLLGVAVK